MDSEDGDADGGVRGDAFFDAVGADEAEQEGEGWSRGARGEAAVEPEAEGEAVMTFIPRDEQGEEVDLVSVAAVAAVVY